MSKIKENIEGSGTYYFMCPGCKMRHHIPTVNALLNGAIWSFNNDVKNPTFSPSVSVKTGTWADPRWQPGEFSESIICHFFIREGKIQFLDDCTHDLKGKTVELDDF